MANKKIKISGRSSRSTHSVPNEHIPLEEPAPPKTNPVPPSEQIPVAQAPVSQNTTGFHQQKRALTRQATDLLAAKVISDSDFPNNQSMPRFFPTPFNNFGHYYLFDYERFLKIIWDSVQLFKSQLNATQRVIPWIVLGVGLSLYFIYIFAADIYDETELFLPLAIVFIIFFGTKTAIRQQISWKFADFRADLIKDLISGTWRPVSQRAPGELEDNLARVGSAEISGPRIPVVVMYDDYHPFPGFGQSQLENMFICRPEKGGEPSGLSESEIFEKVTDEIKEDLEKLGLENFNTGHIVSVHSRSLRMDSNWLDRNKVPHLYFDANNKYNHHLVDKNASSRLFFVVQSVLPEYMTASTFFVRVFKAENALGCQIVVTTLGPPDKNKEYFMRRLATYRAEKNENKDFVERLELFIKSLLPRPKKVWKMKLFQELTRQINIGKDPKGFRNNVKLREIRKKDLLDEKLSGNADYKKKYNQVIDENVMWHGRFFYPLNWRERNSLTFTSDYYGNPEAIGSVKTVYDQISRSVLDAFEGMGFDISDYKDQEGNYSINADKIEQLIVGQKINLRSQKENTDSSNNAKNTIANITRRAKANQS